MRDLHVGPGQHGLWLLVVEVGGEEFGLELASRAVGTATLVAGQVSGPPPRVDLRRALGFSPGAAPGRTVRARIAGAGVVELVVDRVCEAIQVSEALVAPGAGGNRALRLEDRVIRLLPAQTLAGPGPDTLAA